MASQFKRPVNLEEVTNISRTNIDPKNLNISVLSGVLSSHDVNTLR